MDNTEFIVTGAAGHLGSCVVRALLTQGRRVRALVLPNETCPEFIDINIELLKEYTGDICAPASLAPVFEDGAQGELIVIHCAGIISITKKEDRRVYDVNVGGTKNIIEMCKRYHVKRLVYVSSVHAIPSLPHGQTIREVHTFDPGAVPGYYDKTKAIATQMVLDAAADGLDAVVVHPSGIIGPHGLPTGNMARLISLYIRGKLPAAVRGGFDFVDVRDVAEGVVAAALKGTSGECYILSNRFVKIKEMLDILSKTRNDPKAGTGKTADDPLSCDEINSSIRRSGRARQRTVPYLVYLPLWAAKAVTPFTEIYYRITRKTPLFTRYSLNTLSENAVFSHEKASSKLNYLTRPLRETLTDTALWIKMQDRRDGGRFSVLR